MGYQLSGEGVVIPCVTDTPHSSRIFSEVHSWKKLSPLKNFLGHLETVDHDSTNHRGGSFRPGFHPGGV